MRLRRERELAGNDDDDDDDDEISGETCRDDAPVGVTVVDAG
jgi:hypothetical protein